MRGGETDIGSVLGRRRQLSPGTGLRCDEEGSDGDVINMSLPRSREAYQVFLNYYYFFTQKDSLS